MASTTSTTSTTSSISTTNNEPKNIYEYIQKIELNFIDLQSDFLHPCDEALYDQLEAQADRFDKCTSTDTKNRRAPSIADVLWGKTSTLHRTVLVRLEKLEHSTYDLMQWTARRKTIVCRTLDGLWNLRQATEWGLSQPRDPARAFETLREAGFIVERVKTQTILHKERGNLFLTLLGKFHERAKQGSAEAIEDEYKGKDDAYTVKQRLNQLKWMVKWAMEEKLMFDEKTGDSAPEKKLMFDEKTGNSALELLRVLKAWDKLVKNGARAKLELNKEQTQTLEQLKGMVKLLMSRLILQDKESESALAQVHEIRKWVRDLKRSREPRSDKQSPEWAMMENLEKLMANLLFDKLLPKKVAFPFLTTPSYIREGLEDIEQKLVALESATASVLQAPDAPEPNSS